MGKGGNNRTPISGPRQIGVVSAWKNVFGWIKPNRPLKHPGARQDGKVYFGAEDVKEELNGVGAKVSFSLYQDAQGVGATDVRKATAGAIQHFQQKAGTEGRKKVELKPAQGKFAQRVAQKQGKNASTWTKGVNKPQFQKKHGMQATPKAAMQNKQGHQQKNGQAQNGGNKGQQKRNIVHPKPLSGKVSKWLGQFGWLKPNDTIDHPAMQKSKGLLYFSQEDVQTEIKGIGSVVRFMLYEDQRGLGAASVKAA